MNGDHNPLSASSGAPANSAFAPLKSSRASPFPAASAATKNNTMAVPAFIPTPAQPPYRAPATTAQPGFPPSLPAASSFDRDTTTNNAPGNAPLPVTPPTLSSALIRKLPLNTSEESLRLMMVFSKDLSDVEVLPVEQSVDPGFRSAVLRFKSPAGAQEAKNMLDGRSNISNDAQMVVEILGGSATAALGNGFSNDTVLAATSKTGPATAPLTPSSRQLSRFNGTFQSLEKIIPSTGSMYPDLAGQESSAHYQSFFGPHSPIGNHMANGTHLTSKSLIDSVDDDETGELINDPVGFAENGPQRRQTVPQLPINRLASLSLNTTPAPTNGHSAMSYYGHQAGMTPVGLGNTMSPTAMAAGPSMGYNPLTPYRTNNYPPANPADQNPPCNTLYVGNLPIDTSEEELKAMFSKQRGYKRLCFRTKQNGPMCFVEFEDVTFATKALHELYGQPLHNSTKGGIRLSFSKNPLGVRSGQNQGQNGVAGGLGGGLNGMHPGPASGFTTASGPPPGLAAPPGLGGLNRGGGGYTTAGSGGLATGMGNLYGSPTGSNAPYDPWNVMLGHNTTPMTAGSASAFPPYMMGR